MVISSMGKYDHPFIKRSLLPPATAFSLLMVAVTTLWRLRPDLFGKTGQNLYDLFHYTPLVISILLAIGLVISWLGALFLEWDTMDSTHTVQGYYTATLAFVFLMGLTLLLMVIWVHFAGSHAFYKWAGVGQFNPNTFGSSPVLVTVELMAGIRLFTTAQKQFATKKSESARPLIATGAVLSAFMAWQFCHMANQYAGVNTLYSASMAIMMTLGMLYMALLTIGMIFCTIRVYTRDTATYFAIKVLYAIWGGFCIYWGILLATIFLWHSPL